MDEGIGRINERKKNLREKNVKRKLECFGRMTLGIRDL